MTDISYLLGKCLQKIDVEEDFRILFHTKDDGILAMDHHQDCCEQVKIEDITGDLNDLIGNPILIAEERTSTTKTEWDSKTWTFYELATIKGSVTIRWLGESNGYYSESVDFELISEGTK